MELTEANSVENAKKTMKKQLPLHHRAVFNRVKPYQFHKSSTILVVLFAVHESDFTGITPLVQAEGGVL